MHMAHAVREIHPAILSKKNFVFKLYIYWDYVFSAGQGRSAQAGFGWFAGITVGLARPGRGKWGPELDARGSKNAERNKDDDLEDDGEEVFCLWCLTWRTTVLVCPKTRFFNEVHYTQFRIGIQWYYLATMELGIYVSLFSSILVWVIRKMCQIA